MSDRWRDVSGLRDRKTEAWALAAGVRVPLAYAGSEGGKVRRGGLPDVASEPDPRQPRRLRGQSRAGRLTGWLFGWWRPEPPDTVGGVVPIRAAIAVEAKDERPADADDKQTGLAA